MILLILITKTPPLKSIINKQMVHTRQSTHKNNSFPINTIKTYSIHRKKLNRKVANKQTLRHAFLHKKIKPNISKVIHQKRIKNIQNNQKLSEILQSQKYCCPICLNIMISPVLTHCGHSFCMPCLQQSLTFKDKCSVCRQQITCTQLRQSPFLISMINFILTKCNKDEIQIFKQRQEELQVKQRNVRIGRLSVNQLVDYCSNWKWSSGRVIEIIDSLSPIKSIRIVSTSNPNESIILQQTSRRIAKHKTHSNRNKSNHFSSDYLNINFSSILYESSSENDIIINQQVRHYRGQLQFFDDYVIERNIFRFESSSESIADNLQN